MMRWNRPKAVFRKCGRAGFLLGLLLAAAPGSGAPQAQPNIDYVSESQV